MYIYLYIYVITHAKLTGYFLGLLSLVFMLSIVVAVSTYLCASSNQNPIN